MGLPPLFYVVCVAHQFSFLCCGFFYLTTFCILCPILPVMVKINSTNYPISTKRTIAITSHLYSLNSKKGGATKFDIRNPDSGSLLSHSYITRSDTNG